jgi:putative transposase
MYANGMKYAQRPWLTVLRDCATDMALAVWISFRPPSKRSCALVIRQCLREHGRLPEAIICDNGSDFQSVFFSSLLAHCGVDLRFRPSGFPKFGSEAERYFHQFKNLWLSARPGHCGSIQEVRAVSADKKPEKLACMTLSQFYSEIMTFNGWINQYCAGAQSVAPRALHARGLERFDCSGRKLRYDADFVIATSVDEIRYKLDPQRGLHIGHHFYYHPALRLLVGRAARNIPVRLDPEDPFQGYAYVNNSWIACLASGATLNRLRDPLERAAEAIIEADGDEVRKLAKQDAELELVRNMWACDERLRNDDSSSVEGETRSSCHEDDPFAAMAESKIDPLEKGTW